MIFLTIQNYENESVFSSCLKLVVSSKVMGLSQRMSDYPMNAMNTIRIHIVGMTEFTIKQIKNGLCLVF